MLEREQKTYEDRFPTLLEHAGQYVLIHGDEVVDIFTAYEDALRQGYRQFGIEPFLVKLIEGTQTVHMITRKFEPANIC